MFKFNENGLASSYPHSSNGDVNIVVMKNDIKKVPSDVEVHRATNSRLKDKSNIKKYSTV